MRINEFQEGQQIRIVAIGPKDSLIVGNGSGKEFVEYEESEQKEVTVDGE